ncbi:acyl-CoA dehydrogenase family protein [Jatrophihabitans fulvus]
MIDLVEDDDQLAIAATADRLLSERGAAATATDELWHRCAELGWLRLALPEDAGGVGYGVCAQIMLFRELGRALTTGPFLANSLAAHVAFASRRPDLLGPLLDGTVPAALAQSDDAGTVRYFAASPVRVLVVRDPAGEVRLLDAADVRATSTVDTVDPSLRLIEVGLPADTVAPVPAGVRDRVVAAWQVLTAAQLAGIAERVRDMSVRYGLDRVQYGRPIGSFQAVKHRCADMAVRAEAAWAMTSLAAVGIEARLPAAAFDAAAALAVASRAALENSRDNIQNHGAIGFTEEHAAQRYVKRAQVLAASFGTVATRRDALRTASSPW